jgi:hypothetical protein
VVGPLPVPLGFLDVGQLPAQLQPLLDRAGPTGSIAPRARASLSARVCATEKIGVSAKRYMA